MGGGHRRLNTASSSARTGPKLGSGRCVALFASGALA
jgi:hypothetical protein